MKGHKACIIWMLAWLVCAIIPACDKQTDETAGKGLLKPKVHFQQENEAFGLYVVDADGTVIVENVRMESDGSLSAAVYYKEGVAYLVYSPYTAEPEGMPKKSEKTTYDFVDRFFRPLAQKNEGNLRVATGIHLCKGKTEVSFRIAEWRDY